jgi:hypothetical protein
MFVNNSTNTNKTNNNQIIPQNETHAIEKQGPGLGVVKYT